MTRKTVIKICAAYVAVSLVLYEVLSLYNLLPLPLFILAMIFFFAVFTPAAFFYYEWDRYLWAFFSWIASGLGGRVKPPDFSCVRCQSARVITHERTEGNYLYRYFWCKDCGYKWSNIELKKGEEQSAGTPPLGKRGPA